VVVPKTIKKVPIHGRFYVQKDRFGNGSYPQAGVKRRRQQPQRDRAVVDATSSTGSTMM